VADKELSSARKKLLEAARSNFSSTMTGPRRKGQRLTPIRATLAAPRSEIDDLYLKNPYYLIPDGEVAGKLMP
jgi:hypothetical protein